MNFIVPLVVYPYDIMFSIGESDKHFVLKCQAKLPPEYCVDVKEDEICSLSQECRGRTFHHNIGGQTIIRLPSKPITPEQKGTLSHEIFHAVDLIFRHIGIHLSDDSSEAYAYLIGYITEQFYCNIK